MIVLGIDPGKQGGFALISDDEVSVFAMPLDKEGDYNRRALADWFHAYAYKINHVYIEMAAMRRGNSAQSGFVVGRGFGMLEGILNCFHLEYTITYSQTWSKFYPHGVTEPDKDKRYKMIKQARALIAKRLYPDMDLRKSDRSTNLHDGIVDALLIADYGWKRTNNKTEGELDL